jgi:glycosyltransferase involved in cell wall biosynthesis
MASRTRVLILNERDLRHPQMGGAEIHVHEVFGRLARDFDFEVAMLCSSFEGGASQELVDGIEVRRVGGLPFYYPKAALACRRETKAGRVDVVVECLNKLPFFAPLYSHSPVLVLSHHLFGATAFRQVAWPIAATVFAAEKLIPPLYGRWPFVTISQSSADDLATRGIEPARVTVSHCGVEPSLVPVEASKPRPQRVTYVGRLEPYKRVDVMLQAMERLSDRFPEAEIVVMGRGSDRDRLEGVARELGLEARTRFAGFVSDRERDEILAGTRVCVCPSEKEGWGLTVIESNAVATPVVAADAPGLRDSVRHGETGYLAAFADVDAFAERIAALLEDEALSLRMQQAAYAWSKEFDWDRSAAEMAQCLETARALA